METTFNELTVNFMINCLGKYGNSKMDILEYLEQFYFVNNNQEADKIIEDCKMDIWDMINLVMDYENDRYGAFNSRINSKEILNSCFYIESEIIMEFIKFDNIKDLIEQLKQM